jgi:hypothetical protein
MYAQIQKAEKTINFKLWKNSLKSDGQQFHSNNIKHNTEH